MLKPIAEAYGEPTIALAKFRADILRSWTATDTRWPSEGSTKYKEIEAIAQTLCKKLCATRRRAEEERWSEKELQWHLNAELVSSIAPALSPL